MLIFTLHQMYSKFYVFLLLDKNIQSFPSRLFLLNEYFPVALIIYLIAEISLDEEQWNDGLFATIRERVLPLKIRHSNEIYNY